MNITIFIGSLSGGGAERVACNLANFLSEKNNVTLLTMSDSDKSYELRKKVKQVSLYKKREDGLRIAKNIKRIFRLRDYIKKNDVDAYIVMLPKTINLLLSQRKLIKAPIIICERGDPNTRYEASKIKKIIMQYFYPTADGFVFQTSEAKEYYKNVFKGKTMVIPNAINIEFLDNFYVGEKKKYIISSGRLTEQKNFRMLINSFNNLNNKFSDYKLIILGEGPLRKRLELMTEDLGIANKVLLPGYVKNVQQYLGAATLFVLPSDYEGMPNALIEAIALGVPSIATSCPVGGPEFLIKNNFNGFLIPVGDGEKLTKKMEILLNDKNLQEKFSENSKQIKETLNPLTVYGQWELFINEVVSEYKNKK